MITEVNNPKYTIDELLGMIREYGSKLDRVSCSKDVFAALSGYADKEQEHFLVIILDGAKKIIDKKVVHIGTVNQSIVHPREVFRHAIINNAAGIVVAHNHPSGTMEPSNADIRITKRLVEAGRILGIEVLDHIIITKNGYYSFGDEGDMDEL